LTGIAEVERKQEGKTNRDEPDIPFFSALAIRLIAVKNSNSN